MCASTPLPHVAEARRAHPMHDPHPPCACSHVGRALSEDLSCSFYDADDFHPQSNIEKMKAGIPLSDEDREPWLERLRSVLNSHVSQ